MGVPTKNALSGNRLNGATTHSAEANRAKAEHETATGKARTNGLMFNSDALEKSAQDSIAKANAADQAQRAASASGVATEPYVVTRPNGRTVIVAKKDVAPVRNRTEDRDETTKGGALATYNPSHPSVLFHKLKHGLLSRLEILSLRKRLTGWLRSRANRRKHEQDRRQLRPARSDGSRLIQHRSGLIVPAPEQPFMLSETHEAMDDLIAENQRLRRLVDEIIQRGPADLARLRH